MKRFLGRLVRAHLVRGYLLDMAGKSVEALDAQLSPIHTKLMENPIVSIVDAADDDKAVIANLIQLYLYDMTADLPFPVGRDGKFEYDYLDRFWRHPYLVFADDELAGFALVIDTCPVTSAAPCFFMAELFVLKAYRGKGLGRAAFENIVRRHSGRWHIGVIDRNRSASAFWSRVMAAHDARSFSQQFDGETWLVYEFRSTPSPRR